ncbi:Hypothetical protein FKW44_013699 [Caligus rogercresseyi]|uniref:Uncharacterized protein n=1 Tax=Caligus rogercresseyi TaxID=217165 RepID=A0A7T8JZ87_CALRO|nr:Hypothetical protein FKW44_013699 [Caligus rogercresseyi]
MLLPGATRSNVDSYKTIFEECCKEFNDEVSSPDFDPEYGSYLKENLNEAWNNLKASLMDYKSDAVPEEVNTVFMKKENAKSS